MHLRLALIVSSVLLGACSNPSLRELDRNTRGPDEFIVEPKRVLQEPTDYNALPEPTPGGANLADNYPVQDAVIALGGRAENVDAPVPAADAALLASTGRFGIEDDIRVVLAEEDADYRRRRGRFTQIRIVPVDRYDEVYERFALDAEAEVRRWRNAGINTPSFPTDN